MYGAAGFPAISDQFVFSIRITNTVWMVDDPGPRGTRTPGPWAHGSPARPCEQPSTTSSDAIRRAVPLTSAILSAGGIYGYAMVYRYTSDARMLAAAHKVADYYLSRLGNDAVPNWDFDAPTQHKGLLRGRRRRLRPDRVERGPRPAGSRPLPASRKAHARRARLAGLPRRRNP